MRRYDLRDCGSITGQGMSLKTVIDECDLSESEVDEVADMEVGGDYELDGSLFLIRRS